MTMAHYGHQQQPMQLVTAPYPPPDYGMPAAQPSDVDSWTGVLVAVSQLAEQICNTDFVPQTMRGNAAAVTATILSGRELGVGPMTALQHIHIVKGKPGQSAQLMRQLVLTQGHELEYVETTDSRCVVKGRRRGEGEWTTVSFTAQQAKTAGIGLGGYPEDKLVARATSRLCRRKFADCLGGMPYTVEELEDGGVLDDDNTPAPAPVQAEQPAPKRTAQRRTRKAEPAPVKAQATVVQDDPPQGPPLPGEDEPVEPGAPDNAVPDGIVQHEPMITKAQLSKLQIGLKDAGITDRQDGLDFYHGVIGREVTSSKELTKAEASKVIDSLEAPPSDPDEDPLESAAALWGDDATPLPGDEPPPDERRDE